MSQLSLSAVMANYNHGCYLRDMLSSILGQSRRPEEFIVIDDGSTDHSVSIMEEMSAQDPIMRFVRHDQNQGGVESVREAIGLSSGEYLSIPSADDKYSTEFYEKEMDILAQFPEAGLCMSDYSFLFVESGKEVTKRHEWGDTSRYFSPDELAHVMNGNYIAGITAILKRSAVEEVGGFLESLKWHCDWFTNLAVGFRYGVCYVPEALGVIRVQNRSYSASGKRDWSEQKIVLHRILSLLKGLEFQDILPYFIKGKVMNHFGDEIIRAVLEAPEHWDLKTLQLIHYPWWQWSQHIQRKTATKRGWAALSPLEPNVAFTAGCCDEAIARASLNEALPLGMQFLREVPERVEAYLSLAFTAFALNNINIAVETLKNGISRFPDYLPLHHGLAETYSRLGETELAMKSYKNMLELDPENSQAERGLHDLRMLAPAVQEIYSSPKQGEISTGCQQDSLMINCSTKSRPKFSIVTPSFNCGSLIRHCIESVLRQNFESVEHIVVDGASKDSTVDILKEYPHVTWISEPDNGEVEALNKALKMATGDIIGWLNADDCYVDGALTRVAAEMTVIPDCHLVYGKTMFINDDRQPTHWVMPAVPVNMVTLPRWFRLNLFQPSMFFSRKLFEDVGYFDQRLSYGVDYQYWFRIAMKKYSFHFLDHVFSQSMIYRSGGKTETPYAVKAKEWFNICTDYLPCLTSGEQIQFFKDFYAFRISMSKTYYDDAPIETPDTSEKLSGLILAFKELINISPETFFSVLIKTPQLITADIIGAFAENLYRHGEFTEAKKAFEWALALESCDPFVRKRFGISPLDSVGDETVPT
ncbi:MAG: glycosyltransferase [Nitrospirales bacterium]|nr:glycosyltransferase [Nitrospira sp.]MDR4502363.1 glycosyltransferase [Nitrospirales bacterium]